MSSSLEFGKLDIVDLREIWPNEAFHFTPWLESNIEALGEALGFELGILQREAAVGGFSLDLLARDLSRDRVVIIKNQLEPTDHAHLGQLITYAAGFDAGVVIWIPGSVREEHRQALDWLNQHTSEDLELYAVVVEVLRIDGSKPAYYFKPLAFPNARKGQPQNWYSFASGFSGVQYGLDFTRDQIGVEVYIEEDPDTLEELKTRGIQRILELREVFGDKLGAIS